jgi:uncharacterized membrane protein YqjE
MSAIDVDNRPRVGSAHRESIRDLLTRLVGDVVRLLDRELALATAEMKQHVEVLGRTIVLFLAGGVSAAIGLLLLATAAALAIGRTIDSIVGGYLIAGTAITVIGAVVVGMAKSRLTKRSLVPTQTLDEIRRDVTWMTHAGKRRNG